MTDDKALHKGLWERGNIKRPPVPYIPPVDPILEAVKGKSGTKNFKVTLPDGTILYHAVYDSGSNVAFVIHVQEVLNFYKQKGSYKAYTKAQSHCEDCVIWCANTQKTLNDANGDPTTTP